MQITTSEQFKHRHNSDGTHDSICCTCYMTAAKALTDSELCPIEDVHVCDPVQHYLATHCAQPAA
jgi:hypothetical protein